MHETGAAWMGSPQWGMLVATTLYLIGISQAWIALSAVFRVARSTWPRPLQPVLESMVMFAPLAVALLIALLVGRHHIFSWLGRHEDAYWLNIPQLAFRNIMVNLIFYLLGMALFFKGRTLKPLSLIVLSTFTIMMFFTAQTILSWDFGSNLIGHWYPSVFAPWFIVGSLQVGVAAAILTFAFLRRSPMGPKINLQQFDFMGQLLLGFTFVWIYTGFSLYMVYWYGNIPHEIEPVNLRIWNWAPRLFWAMMIVKLFLPFFMLINTQVRHSVGALSFVAILVLVGGAIEKYLIVVPAVHPAPLVFDASLLLPHAAILGGGIVVALVAWRMFLRRNRVLETI